MSKVTSTQNLALYDSCPIGAIIAFPAFAIPGGWLECNGQAIKRVDFPELFLLIGTSYGIGDGVTTFNLPDYRGTFLRHKDNGKGYDPNRNLGTFQDQDVQPHTHPIPFSSAGSSGGSATFSPNNGAQNPGPTTQLSTGTETRPKNVSVLYCIKATMAINTGLSTISTFASLGHTVHNGEATLLQQNGYKKFADGLILQWGFNNPGGNAFNFPIAFPNVVYSLTYGISGTVGSYGNLLGLTTTGCNGFNTSSPTYWQAIGR